MPVPPIGVGTTAVDQHAGRAGQLPAPRYVVPGNRAEHPGAEGLVVVAQHPAGPDEQARRSELLETIRVLIQTELSERQREVLDALTIQEIPIDVLAERLGSTRGALYKTLHDARRKLRALLAAAGHDLTTT